MWAVMSALGAVATLVAIAASATLNYRYTFKMFGDGAIESYAYALVAVCLDLLKALAPLFIAARARERDRYAVLGGVIILAFGIPWSFMCATGLAAQNRSDRAVPVENRQAGFQAAKDELARIESRLERVSTTRSVREIEAEIASGLRATLRVGRGVKTIGELSADCAKPTRATAAACASTAKLRQELAAAQEREALEKAAKEARATIGRLRDAGAGEGRLADAQAQILARWLSDMQGWAVSIGTVQFAFAILLAAVFEAVTAFGLSLSLGRNGLPSLKIEQARPAAGEDDDTVEAFCRTRLKPAPGSKLSFKRAFEGYAAWCEAERLEPLPQQAFRGALREAAKAQGLSVAGGIIHNVALEVEAGEGGA